MGFVLPAEFSYVYWKCLKYFYSGGIQVCNNFPVSGGRVRSASSCLLAVGNMLLVQSWAMGRRELPQRAAAGVAQACCPLLFCPIS